MADDPRLFAAAPAARLERGAHVLLIVFWAIHLGIMLVRAELNDATDRMSFFDSVVKRTSFALFGAMLGYALYRALRLVRQADFRRQIAAGALLALVTGCIQGLANSLAFNKGDPRIIANAIYSSLYWFWFYFCWTTAYLAFAYNLAVQEQQRRAAALAVEAREAQVRALRYQVNPHFLFNTLNAIAALTRDAPQRAEQMVIQLSDFFRRSLAVDPSADLRLADEIELQRLYLDIERTRFPDRLRFSVELEGAAADALVPALLLQPLVENAVKHGVSRSEKVTTITIGARVDGDILEIVVEDDARASGPARTGESVGLRNVRERIVSRHAAAANLSAQPVEGGGFRNVIRLPYRR